MPMIHDRNARGRTKIGWLDSYHTFSMGGFYDPNRIQHRALRVLNEDRVIPGAGFGTHGHKDMDIISVVLDGALRHKDSMGNGSIIQPGEIQAMSAGTGITHSEMNASETDPVHFFQIWIIPDERGLPPRYQQKTIDATAAKNEFHPIATPEGEGDAIKLHSDTSLYLAKLDEGTEVSHVFETGRAGFLQILSGEVEIEGNRLKAGDGLQFEATTSCSVLATETSDILLFDLR